MRTYIQRQPKHTRERIEAKVDSRLAKKLERYCEYLDSDRDYIVSQALEIAFRKDKGFADWLRAQSAGSLLQETADTAAPIGTKANT